MSHLLSSIHNKESHTNNYGKTIMIGFLAFLFILTYGISITSANLEGYGTFKQGQTIRFAQVCSDATYINLSSITFPDSTIAVSNIEMTSAGNGEFYYNFVNTTQIGRYDIRGISDGCENTFATYFEVDATGRKADSRWIMEVIIWLLAFPTILWILVLRQEIPLIKMIGYTALILNSIIGLTILQTMLGWIALLITMILAFKYLFQFLETDMPRNFGSKLGE